MNCIFKKYGYVPQKHICINCVPLEKIFLSVGLNEKKASEASSYILKTFKIINLEDSFRDDGPFKKIISKVSNFFLINSLPRKLKEIVIDINSTITRLEFNGIEASVYLKKVSRLGGLLFQAIDNSGQANKDKVLSSIGSKLAGAVVVDDMVRDISEDFKKKRFNPFNSSDKDYINSLFEKYIGSFKELMNPIMKIQPVSYKLNFFPGFNSCCPEFQFCCPFYPYC